MIQNFSNLDQVGITSTNLTHEILVRNMIKGSYSWLPVNHYKVMSLTFNH